MPRATLKRYWTCHWQFRYWRPDVNSENQPVCSSGSNSFRKRGVTAGDSVYIISLSDGQLYLGGRMTVKRILSRKQAVRLWNDPNLFNADEWVVDPDQSGTPLHLHRRLAPVMSRQIRFVSHESEPKGWRFVTKTRLDNQTTRGVRELTRESAELLDQIIDITDRLPRSGELITVTDSLLEDLRTHGAAEQFSLPEEVRIGAKYAEGSVERIMVNRYERDPRAREECIGQYGTRCFLCGFDFVVVYGEVMMGFIHVHHLNSLATAGPVHKVDPVEDLRPVCPNCHAVLHRREPPYSLEEVRRFLEGSNGGTMTPADSGSQWCETKD